MKTKLLKKLRRKSNRIFKVQFETPDRFTIYNKDYDSYYSQYLNGYISNEAYNSFASLYSLHSLIKTLKREWILDYISYERADRLTKVAKKYCK